MTTEVQIEQSALEIPADARLRLAAKLLASVPGRLQPQLGGAEALDLAARRAAELDGGKVTGLDYRAQMDRVRASIRRCD